MPSSHTKAGGSVHVVESGQTSYSIARQYGTRPGEIAALNGLLLTTAVRIGQRLRIPCRRCRQRRAATGLLHSRRIALRRSARRRSRSGNWFQTTAPTRHRRREPKIRLTSPVDSAESGQLVMNAPKIPAMPEIPADRQAPSATNAVATADIDNAADPASADGKSFRWPVRGRIISGFGTKPNGEKNDGINLAVPEGTSVKAVEAGTVIYAGNELEGYGNLVLIRHADGWVSAYAHNKDILVKRGDPVRRGQTIAHAGMSGSVAAPQVHFELRKGAKPVNPLDYLAGA